MCFYNERQNKNKLNLSLNYRVNYVIKTIHFRILHSKNSSDVTGLPYTPALPPSQPTLK